MPDSHSIIYSLKPVVNVERHHIFNFSRSLAKCAVVGSSCRKCNVDVCDIIISCLHFNPIALSRYSKHVKLTFFLSSALLHLSSSIKNAFCYHLHRDIVRPTSTSSKLAILQVRITLSPWIASNLNADSRVILQPLHSNSIVGHLNHLKIPDLSRSSVMTSANVLQSILTRPLPFSRWRKSYE